MNAEEIFKQCGRTTFYGRGRFSRCNRPATLKQTLTWPNEYHQEEYIVCAKHAVTLPADNWKLTTQLFQPSAQHPMAATGDCMTHEACPTCGSPATCEHLSGTHVWDCPECGEIVATVGYPCPQCAAQHADEADASPKGVFAKR